MEHTTVSDQPAPDASVATARPETVEATETTTGLELFTDKAVVALRVAGELRDLTSQVHAGDVVEPVFIDSPDGLSILRHSAAHVMAQAVQAINPEAKLGIGPPVTDGFYYDFDVAEPFTPDDLKAIEKGMERIIRQGQRFRRRVVTDAEARELLADEPYKLELIGLKGGADGVGDDGESVEVGGAELTV
jgi:threonyl-tRNA synthetase